MSDWGQGYTTDTSYTYSFFRELAPSYLRMICLLQGIAPPQGPLTYLELGCGQGLGPILLAATNPDDTFIGVDFAPEHVLGARRLAEATAITNVMFMEEDFAALAAHPELLPDCDIIVLHGVYSWVGPEQREAIRNIIRQKLKPGGLVYISYNCAAGWAALASFQKMFRDMSLSRGGGFAQTSATLERLSKFRDAEFGLFSTNPVATSLLDLMRKQTPTYVHHEFMNEYWTPFYFQDVAQDMRSCKLSFVGTCNPAENVDRLSFPDAVLELVNAEPDADLRESLKDLHCVRRFRKDLYIRGILRLSENEQRGLLAEERFALTKPRASIDTKIRVPRGELGMARPGYSAILDALERAPSSLGGVVPSEQLRDLLVVLLHVGAVHPAERSGSSRDTARRLNKILTANWNSLTRFTAYAAPGIGSGFGFEIALIPLFAAVLRGDWREGDDEIVLDRICSDRTYSVFFSAAADEQKPPSDLKRDLRNYLPIWRALGLID